ALHGRDHLGHANVRGAQNAPSDLGHVPLLGSTITPCRRCARYLIRATSMPASPGKPVMPSGFFLSGPCKPTASSGASSQTSLKAVVQVKGGTFR
ncbi:MAG: hypothetical protein ACXW39_03245, partial [Nitrospira sp.]